MLFPRARFYILCLPALKLLTFLPSARNSLEFIPVAAVVLPAASLSAFVVLSAGGNPGLIAGGGRKKNGPKTSLLIFAVSFLAFLASGFFVNETTGYHRGDEAHYFTMARSIAEDFDIDIINQIPGYRPSWKGTARISPFSRDGFGYSWHPPGLSYVFAPFFRFIEDDVNKKRRALVSLYIIPDFLGAHIFLAARESSPGGGTAFFVWAIFMFSSPLWLYSIRAYPMVPGGLCLLYCWRRLVCFSKSSRAQIVLFNLLLYLSVYLPGGSSAVHWTGGSSHPGRRLAACVPLTAPVLAHYLTTGKKKYSFYWLVLFMSLISVATWLILLF